MLKKVFKIADQNYRQVLGSIDDRYLRGSSIEFWIYALIECRTGESLPVKGRAVKSIPKEIDLSKEERYLASRAAEQGMLWYFKIEGKGWDWLQPKGNKDVPQIHAVLQWIQRFKTTDLVEGCKLIHVEVGNQLKS